MKKQNILSHLTGLQVFNRWSRKPYAVFASLHSVVKIAFLTNVVTLLSIPEKGFSQQDTIKINNHLDIDEVIVSGERSPEVYSKLSRVVTVMPEEALKSAPAQSLHDVLEIAPALDLRTRGKHGVQADLSIRGGTFDQNLILLNGVNFTDPQTGHLSLSLPIDIESINRIEILEGPSSRIMGANAFSGAVNFVTTPTDSINKVNASLMGGEHQFTKTSVSASLTNNYIKNYVAFSLASSNGYTHNTDFKTYNLYYNGQIDIENTQLNIQMGMMDKGFGSNSFYGSKYLDQYEENSSALASVNATTGKTLKLSTTAYWRRMDDHFVLIRENPEIYQNFHLTDIFGSNTNITLNSAIGKTTVGAELRNESIRSNNLGFETNDSLLVGGTDSIYYTKKHTRSNLGLFIEHSYHTNRLSISAGGVFNYNTDQSVMADFYPGIDASYKILAPIKVYASINQSFRMPTFTDLFYAGPENLGNPQLKPEKATTYEGGLKVLTKQLFGNASVFYRKGTDIIAWTKANPQEAVWQPNNITELNTLGIEAQARMNTAPYLMNVVYGVRSFHLGYLYLDVTRNSNNAISRYAMDHLNQKLTAGCDIRVYKWLYSNWQLNYQKRNGEFQQYNFDTEGFESFSYEPFTTIDARIYAEIKSFTIYAEASNILDTEFYDIGGVPQPERWIRAGVKTTLGFAEKHKMH